MNGLSVVIPTLNEHHYIGDLLESLARALWEKSEVFVVDVSGGEETLRAAQIVASKHPQLTVRLVKSPVRGVSAQRNYGASLARYDTLLFLDADVVIPPDTSLQEMVELFVREKMSVASCRFAPTNGSLLGRLYFSHILYRFHQFHRKKKNVYALGAFILANADAFRAAGGFDPSIRVNEDAELAGRLRGDRPFHLFPHQVHISTRRFETDGYVRTSWLYMRLWAYRTFKGELRDESISYTFGHYDS